MNPFLPIIIGIDTIASSFFGQWYQTTDLAHYLDNGSAYTVYETETTGELNLSNQLVFSIAGNSFRQNKYHLNGMRIDSRTMPGNMLLHTQMDRTFWHWISMTENSFLKTTPSRHRRFV